MCGIVVGEIVCSSLSAIGKSNSYCYGKLLYLSRYFISVTVAITTTDAAEVDPGDEDENKDDDDIALLG